VLEPRYVYIAYSSGTHLYVIVGVLYLLYTCTHTKIY